MIFVIAVLASGNDDALRPWHKEAPSSEFESRDADADFSFTDYLQLEEKVFTELETMLDDEIEESSGMATSRFQPGGPNNPLNFPVNWNRTLPLSSHPTHQ